MLAYAVMRLEPYSIAAFSLQILYVIKELMLKILEIVVYMN
jgi:hypothetical protein